ncbi:MAG TPA: hypothetical protein EYQ50_06205 [Verrucomicrobiales bacterium]|nr:hypothetical protein [Verrucomicrobiales bacterium]HIL70540.1 hypothetical protein [Verrucomicrobiota bacterium]
MPGDLVEFSRGTRQFRFHYTGLSFLNPSQVRFRYQLEGFDSDWIEAEDRREAYYNDIPPGRYRFRGVASNNDGVWNESGASFAFYLPPRFYQTLWFFGFCVAITVLLAWAVHRRRMQMAESQFSIILAERSRIARDLHDTLAQGFAGIAFQLEAVTCNVDDAPSQAQRHLKVALSMVRHSLAEARRSVMNLRSTALDNGDLAGALAETAQSIMADRSVDLKVRTIGAKRSLSSEIEQSLLRVGQEAITNSLKHSGASRIQVSLDYEPNFVRLNITDNGQGFQVPSSDLDDGIHFGLLGMHERAKQVNGRLEIRSLPDSGSHLLLEIPTHTKLLRYDEKARSNPNSYCG